MVITLGPRGRQTLSTSTPCVRRRRSSTGTTPIPCHFHGVARDERARGPDQERSRSRRVHAFGWRANREAGGNIRAGDLASPSTLPVRDPLSISSLHQSRHGGAHVSGGARPQRHGHVAGGGKRAPAWPAHQPWLSPPTCAAQRSAAPHTGAVMPGGRTSSSVVVLLLARSRTAGDAVPAGRSSSGRGVMQRVSNFHSINGADARLRGAEFNGPNGSGDFFAPFR